MFTFDVDAEAVMLTDRPKRPTTSTSWPTSATGPGWPCPGCSGPGYSSSLIMRPSDAVAAWGEELDAIVAVGGLFDLTMHPFISGRPARAAALESLIRRAQAMDGVWVAAGDEIAAWVAGLDLPPVTHEPPQF